MPDDKQPEGGHDSTPLKPSSGPTYTVRITFHSAHNVPVSDYGTRSSDPYILAQMQTPLPTRHREDPHLRFRSQTIHRTTEPEWNAQWIVGGVPESGFSLSIRLYDEDPEDHDDRLGKVGYDSGRLSEKWKGLDKEEFKVKKTGADVVAYSMRWAGRMLCKSKDIHARLVMSVEVLGKTEEEVGKVYTMNNFWWVHYSPMIGRLAGVKSNDEKGVERFK